MYRSYAYVVITILMVPLFLISGCGIKGPPVPPGYAKPPAVSDLQYQVTGNQLNLTWSVPPPKDATKKQAVAGARVFRLKQSLKNTPCQDCPQVFTLIKNIPARSGTMQFQDTIDNGFAYYYKIVLFDAGNHDGADSNIIYVEN
jgi:predicted small lipoprotein YifL